MAASQQLVSAALLWPLAITLVFLPLAIRRFQRSAGSTRRGRLVTGLSWWS
jgi:hypothetical protein